MTTTFVLPEQIPIDRLILAKIRGNVCGAMNIAAVTYNHDFSPTEISSQRLTCAIHPKIARLKLITQYHFELVQLGYPIKDVDLADINTHLVQLHYTPNYCFQEIISEHKDRWFADKLRLSILYSVIRLIEDEEWFTEISQGL